MLAPLETKRNPTREQPQGLPETIFAGLSFPSVPTNDIVIKQHLYSQLSTAPPSAEEDEAEISAEESKTPLISSGVDSSIGFAKSNTQINPTVVSPMIQRYGYSSSANDLKRHLSRLYAPTEPSTQITNQSASKLYPELPEVKLNSRVPETDSLLGRNQGVSSDIQGTRSVGQVVEMSHMNNATTYNSAVAQGYPVSTMPYHYHPSQQVSNQHYAVSQMAPSTNGMTINRSHPASAEESEQLINDLIAQNSQLSQEVLDLRNRLAEVTGSSSGTTLGLDINSPARGEAMSGGPEAATSDNRAEGIKYICCGNCRHWFQTGRDIVYVSCPQCEAINNCGPTETRQRAQAEAETRALTQRRDLPWYLQCLQGIV